MHYAATAAQLSTSKGTHDSLLLIRRAHTHETRLEASCSIYRFVMHIDLSLLEALSSLL